MRRLTLVPLLVLSAVLVAVLAIERSRAGGEAVERFISTSLVHHREGGWKLMHWHLSPAEAPAPEGARK